MEDTFPIKMENDGNNGQTQPLFVNQDSAPTVEIVASQEPDIKDTINSEQRSEISLGETPIDGNEVNGSTLASQPQVNVSSDGVNFFVI